MKTIKLEFFVVENEFP